MPAKKKAIKKVSRAARSIKTIRKARREAGLCVVCGKPSMTFRCKVCNPPKAVRMDKDQLREIRRKAALARWQK